MVAAVFRDFWLTSKQWGGLFWKCRLHWKTEHNLKQLQSSSLQTEMKIYCEDASAAAMSGVSAGSNPEASSCAHWEKFVEGARHVVFGSILNVLLLALPLVIVAVYFNLGHVSISSKLLDFLNYMRLNFTGTVTLFTSL